MKRYHELQYGCMTDFDKGWAIADFLTTLQRFRLIREVKTVSDTISIWIQVYQ